jgi:hypothetical protein
VFDDGVDVRLNHLVLFGKFRHGLAWSLTIVDGIGGFVWHGSFF